MKPDHERTAQAIVALCEAFNRKASPAMIAAYAMGLQGLGPDLIERACRLALQRSRFMPVPAELREMAITDGRDYGTVAEAAFRVLQRAAVRRLGGWQRVAGTSREGFDVWLRKDFVEAYTRIIRDGCQPEELRYNPGGNELRNGSMEGLPLPGGGVYELTRFGGAVVTIAVGYRFLLPAPEPAQLTAASARQGIAVSLKRLTDA
jgi:hypothetical protein